MAEQELQTRKTLVLGVEHLQALFDALLGQGYVLAGPTLRDGAIVYDEITSTADLPVGWTDTQDAGTYRLDRRDDGALFGYVVGQHSWKRFLHPSSVGLWEARRKGGGFQMTSGNGEFPRYAFIGVRPCEIRAMEIHDKIFIHGEHQDHIYKTLREGAFILAVNCPEPGGTCFCSSMGTGPRATDGYDLALTEITGPEGHHFLVDVGTERGEKILAGIPHNPATEEEIQVGEERLSRALGNMGRMLETDDLKGLLYSGHDHPRWEEVAERCMSCGNCTMVCPTCFCNTIVDNSDLKGETAVRMRRWDSCFTVDFAFIHGGSTRPSARARYRQWLTHKFAYWQDQFGVIGCVGCGRCITWCPAGIDITEELQAIRGIEPVCKTCVPSREKSFETMRRMLAEHPMIREMGEQYIDLVTECSSIVRFNPGEFIVHTGEDADRFYLIRHGMVAIEVFTPERGTIIVQTIGEGEILGWSWFMPPYKWHFDAQAVELTRAIAVEARRIREACDRDVHLGYVVNRYLAQVMGQRMEATRMQLLDVYGDRG
jgi:sulfhydrogenase subunit beta (sulfur reductase)